MEYWEVTGRYPDGSVHTAKPGYPRKYPGYLNGKNPSLRHRSNQINNDPEFKPVFDLLGLTVSRRKFNTEKMTKFGEHLWLVRYNAPKFLATQGAG